MDVPRDLSGLTDVQVVRPLQESGCPINQAPSPQGAQAAADDDMECGFLAPQKAQRHQQRGLDLIHYGIQSAAPRLANRQIDDGADDETRYPEGKERRAPAIRMSDSPRHVRAQPCADR